ncbi:MAG: PepSY-associated TM helix domain-containing protein [Cyclobacteriaceae bacterium]
MSTRTWFRIHSFTGVITGLLLFVICWSGTFAVISNELDWLVAPQVRVDPLGEQITPGAIKSAAEKAYPESSFSYLILPKNNRLPASVNLLLPDESYVEVLVNPYTAEVLNPPSGYDLAIFFRQFHTNLFGLEYKLGNYIVFSFGLILMTSLVSALFLYKRWWTRFFSWKRNRSGQSYWTQLHKLAGVWSLWFLTIIAITGAWYFFESLRLDLGDGKVNYVGETEFAIIQPAVPTSDPALPHLPLDSLVAKAKAIWPNFEIVEIAKGWYSESSESIYLAGHLDNPLVRERGVQMQFDPRTGEVLWKNAAGDLPAYWLWSNMADPLHFGNFGGLISKIIWFLFGLLLCGLILTGTYLHIKKLHQKNGWQRHGWRGTWWATGITIFILLATIPYGFESARWYGPVVDGVRQLPDLFIGVKLFIIAWTLLTLAMILAWVMMLWKAAKQSKSPGYKDSVGSASGVNVRPTSQSEKKQVY